MATNLQPHSCALQIIAPRLGGWGFGSAPRLGRELKEDNMILDIKPQAKTEWELWQDWKNQATAKFVSAVGKKITVRTGTRIQVRDSIFNGYAWTIDVKTPTKEMYQRTYGENWQYHYHLYMVWNTKKF